MAQAQGRLEMLDERIDRLTEQLHEVCSIYRPAELCCCGGRHAWHLGCPLARPRILSRQAVEENMALRERLADVIDAEPDRNFNDGYRRAEGRYLR